MDGATPKPAVAQFAGRVQCGEPVVFHERAAFAVIVIQVASDRRVKQAAEVVEAMTIMSANGSIEGYLHFTSVSFVADLHEQRFALPQGLDDGLDQFAIFICRSCIHEF